MKRNWIMLIIIFILGGILILYARLYWSLITPADQLQIMLLLALVAVTGFYAWSAEKQALASVEMAQEMRQQRLDSVRPILAIEKAPTFQIEDNDTSVENYTIQLLYMQLKNVGVGPALSICCTLTYPDHNFNPSTFTVIAVGEPYKQLYFATRFSRGMKRLDECRGTIRLEYTDVFHNRRWSQVSFVVNEQQQTVMKWGELEVG